MKLTINCGFDAANGKSPIIVVGISKSYRGELFATRTFRDEAAFQKGAAKWLSEILQEHLDAELHTVSQ